MAMARESSDEKIYEFSECRKNITFDFTYHSAWVKFPGLLLLALENHTEIK